MKKNAVEQTDPPRKTATMSVMSIDTPKLPKWPFLALDALLLVTAAWIAMQSPSPLEGLALGCVVGCVVLATLVCMIPYLVDYARDQERAVDERQRVLEGMTKSLVAASEQVTQSAREVGNVSEQIRLGVGQIEKLPSRLNEEFSKVGTHVQGVRTQEMQRLEAELASLRGLERERIDQASRNMAQAMIELGRIEALSSQFEQSANTAVRKLQQETESSAEQLGRLVSGALQSLGQESQKRLEEANVRMDALSARSHEELGRHIQDLDTKIREAARFAGGVAEERARAVDAQLDARVSQVSSLLEQRIENVETRISLVIAQLEQVASRLQSPVIQYVPVPVQTTAVVVEREVQVAVRSERVAQQEVPSEKLENDVNPAPAESPALAPEIASGSAEAELDSGDLIEPEAVPAVPSNQFEEDGPAPMAPETDDEDLLLQDLRPTETAQEQAVIDPVSVKSEVPAPMLDLFSTDYNFEEAMTSHEQQPVSVSLSSDGMTRLLVTSYVGQGNKVYIRAEGQDRGVLLEFLSVGKWRWQSADVYETLKVRIYKNDRVECPGLGDILVEPGHQTEVTAKF